MTVSFVGEGTAVTNATFPYATATLTPGLPASIADGDVLLAVAVGNAGDNLTSPPTVTAPSGWVFLGSIFPDRSGSPRDPFMAAWVKPYATGDSAPTFTFPSSFLGDFRRCASMRIAGYRGILRPILASNVTTDTTNISGTLTPSAPTLTRTATPFAIAMDTSTAISVSTANGYTTTMDASHPTMGTNRGLVLVDLAGQSAGVAAMPTFGLAGGGNGNGAISFALAFERHGWRLGALGFGPRSSGF